MDFSCAQGRSKFAVYLILHSMLDELINVKTSLLVCIIHANTCYVLVVLARSQMVHKLVFRFVFCSGDTLS